MLFAVRDSTKSVERLFCGRLEAMLPFALEVLQIANCKGDEIDEAALAIMFSDKVAEIDPALRVAADEGFVHLNPERYFHPRQSPVSHIFHRCRSCRVGTRRWTSTTTTCVGPVLGHKPLYDCNAFKPQH